MGSDSGLGADFLQLRPASAPAKGLTSWLVDALRQAITDGRLRDGARLPATRALAEDLRVSRGVVVEAYRRLGDEGLVGGRTGVGTVVTSLGPPARRPPPPDWRDTAAPLLPLPPRPGVAVDLSPGVPDLSAFPRSVWLRAERAVLDNATASNFGYGDPRGSGKLRQELADWLTRTRGIRATADDIIVVAGVAQALALLAQWLRGRGSTAIGVEDPGSRGARDELVHWGLDPVPVPVDSDGMRTGELAASGPPAVLLTPAHQFPTGAALAPYRRHTLLDWAAKENALIVEDDYDADYRYDRAPVPALQASAPDHVAYTGSTSKSLAPGMRLGWLIPPRHMYADLVVARHASDLGSPALPQLVLAHLIATGELDRHIRLMRARHRTRRDALLTSLHQHLPQARVHGVAAGLHVQLTLPDDAGLGTDTAVAERIRQAAVNVHPLSWYRVKPGPPGLVLGYAAHSPHRLRTAAQRIAETTLS
ncbi:PLP-dependent aminotransferase family protein [Amycolatopsis suaedae]|uniref:PLP-dependent aminotransferase family protein n=1 Tax=Amycolatopsis suaedae TaxID=2510978 RepID=A0A4Q7J4U7_9PSEU|nr:PLP-dependent aminotransferase family protein [Amycolatopsis suaedae]RZQ61044.1 PLP-dependent aminotransferase family protein [Amycolatopsis suaedae]